MSDLHAHDACGLQQAIFKIQMDLWGARVRMSWDEAMITDNRIRGKVIVCKKRGRMDVRVVVCLKNETGWWDAQRTKPDAK